MKYEQDLFASLFVDYENGLEVLEEWSFGLYTEVSLMPSQPFKYWNLINYIRATGF